MTRIIVLITVIILSAVQVFGQILPPDPGAPGAAVPLDGGILLALLAAGSVGASLYAKSKKKDK